MLVLRHLCILLHLSLLLLLLLLALLLFADALSSCECRTVCGSIKGIQAVQVEGGACRAVAAQCRRSRYAPLCECMCRGAACASVYVLLCAVCIYMYMFTGLHVRTCVCAKWCPFH